MGYFHQWVFFVAGFFNASWVFYIVASAPPARVCHKRMALRAFAFKCTPDTPVGDSLHDAALSYARGIDGVRDAIDASPPIRQRVDIITRGAPITLDVVFTAKWVGGDPLPPTMSVANAMLTSATYARRFPVTLRVETSKNGVIMHATSTVAHLELPLIVESALPPPDTGYFVVHGKEYVIRYQVHTPTLTHTHTSIVHP